jgi:Flp pilus assembly protein TadD
MPFGKIVRNPAHPWLRSRPADLDLLRHLAFTLARAGRGAEATSHAARACELEPWDPRTWSDRGCVHAMLGDLRPALLNYQTAIGIDRDFAVAWHNLGVTLARIGDARAAVRALRNAFLLEGRPDTCFALGRLLADTGLVDAALASFARAEELTNRQATCGSPG